MVGGGAPWVRSPFGVGGFLGGFLRLTLSGGLIGTKADLGLGGSWGPPPCSFFTSISLLRLRASRSFPKEPLRRKEPLPSWGVNRFVSVLCWLHSLLAHPNPDTHSAPLGCGP